MSVALAVIVRLVVLLRFVGALVVKLYGGVLALGVEMVVPASLSPALFPWLSALSVTTTLM